MWHEGIGYLKFFNITDQMNTVTFVIYLYLRMTNLGGDDEITNFIITSIEEGAPMEKFKKDVSTHAALSILSVIILLWALIKIMFFMQISQSFGLLVQILV